jgi:hypothetical protein
MKKSGLIPAIMKKITEPNFNFTAYPLKALNLPVSDSKSTLHIFTKQKGKAKYAFDTKVFPMVNPYKEIPADTTTARPAEKPQPDNVEEREAEWFASYE